MRRLMDISASESRPRVEDALRGSRTHAARRRQRHSPQRRGPAIRTTPEVPIHTRPARARRGERRKPFSPTYTRCRGGIGNRKTCQPPTKIGLSECLCKLCEEFTYLRRHGTEQPQSTKV